jgi:hypothetical protein
MQVPIANINDYLDKHHYLGRARRGWAWSDDYGVAVYAKPTSRRLPNDGTWLELTRWCLVGMPNGGTRQWRLMRRFIAEAYPQVTTIVSYSDPSVGHTGALYRACNWLWAPTWHRLRPPPSGNGRWQNAGKVESVKDRWYFPMRRDERRAHLLSVSDASLARRGMVPAIR